jgi:hypothetical protein
VRVLGRAFVRACAAFGRLVRWSLATVEDELPSNVIPMPGPAHGPVPAIELRLEEQRRRAS